MCMYVNGAFSSCENTSEVCTHTPAEFASTKKHSTHTHTFIQTHTSENSKKSHFFIAQNLQFALLMVYAPKCMPAQANIHTHIYIIFFTAMPAYHFLADVFIFYMFNTFFWFYCFYYCYCCWCCGSTVRRPFSVRCFGL